MKEQIRKSKRNQGISILIRKVLLLVLAAAKTAERLTCYAVSWLPVSVSESSPSPGSKMSFPLLPITPSPGWPNFWRTTGYPHKPEPCKNPNRAGPGLRSGSRAPGDSLTLTRQDLALSCAFGETRCTPGRQPISRTPRWIAPEQYKEDCTEAR